MIPAAVRERLALPACLLLAAVVTLPLLGARDLWAPDEPRYAQVAQEMLRDGHWWYPHVNGRAYPDKPPLYFWLAAAAGAPEGRVGEAAARLPSALAHLLLVAVTYGIGRRLFGPAAAIVAAAALATTWLEAWMSRRACLDVVLSLSAACAIAGMLRAGAAARAGSRAGAWGWGAASGIAAALGIMTKGPVLLLSIAGAGVPLLLSRSARAGRPRGPALGAFVAGILAAGAVLAAWLLLAASLGGYPVLEITSEHVVDRAAEGRHHAAPPWYFLSSVPADFLPWTLLALPAIAWAWRRRAEWPHALLLGWALLPLAAHSIIVEKRNIYALPVAPAWALLCGAWVASQERAGDGLRRATAIAAALLLLLGAAALIGPRLPLGGEATAALSLPRVPGRLAVVGAAAVLGGVGIALACRRRASPVGLALAVALAYGLTLGALALALPALDPLKSSRAMGEVIRAETGEAPLGMYPRTWDAYVYYSGRVIADLGEGDGAAEWLRRVGRPAYVLAYERDLDRLPSDGGSAPRSVAADDVGHRRVHLLRYEAAPEIP